MRETGAEVSGEHSRVDGSAVHPGDTPSDVQTGEAGDGDLVLDTSSLKYF